VTACGVCHAKLDEIVGWLKPPKLPLILGYKIVDRIENLGAATSR